MQTSVNDSGTRVDSLANQNAKYEKKIMAWLRAFSRACHLDPGMVAPFPTRSDSIRRVFFTVAF